ncbi:unnamed protein product [Owenia fusiformis]|uniref:Uncharacterized protein n=1 Tax=Owenia fusiformis TaxID=6347 RepID=A0A8J1TU12_OWEFU|nr:unnamed protein product [Owenia fusiformis]
MLMFHQLVALVTLLGTVRGQSARGGQETSQLQGPVFIGEPPSYVAYANTKGIMLSCTAFGRPAPAMDWTNEEGAPIDSIPGVLEILPNNSLHILPFSSSKLLANVHSTNYRCTATNSVGTVVSRRVTVQAVTVDQHKAYSVRVNDVWVTIGDTAVFKCSINPYFVRPYVTVTTWSQGDKPISAGGRFSILQSGQLHVRDVRIEDSYMPYKCVTENSLTGDSKTSDPAFLRVLEQTVNSAPSIDEKVFSITVEQGETAELPCVASGHPTPVYTWQKGDMRIVLDHNRVTQMGGNLVIRNTGIRDSGEYTCSASNRYGMKTVTTTLTITSALSAFIQPQRQVVDVDKPVTFNCSVFGHPVNAIHWYKDGRRLSPNAHFKFPSNAAMTITAVKREDKGMYQCMPSNDNDNAQGSTQLVLGVAKPIIHYWFEDKYVQPGPSVSLKCVTSGNPTPIVIWTLDDGPLPQDPRLRVSSYVNPKGDVISHVNISKVEVSDGGQYKCSATNSVGQAMRVGKLNVYGVPYIRPMSNITAVANRLLIITCHASGYPIKSISWHKGGSQLPINHRQHVSKDGTLTIRSVQRGDDEGKYTCTVSNSNNQGMSRSLYISVKVPPMIDPFTFPKIKQGDRVSRSCVVSRGDLPITIEWYKDDQAIPADLGITVMKTDIYSSTLSIGDASPRHNGNYTCVASNKAASTNYTSELHVDVPPRWVREPQDSYVVLHNSIIIDCQTAGTPQPTITWKKAASQDAGDYLDLDTTSPSQVRQLKNGSLSIKNAAEKDHGIYLCHASNGIGQGLSKVITLIVHVPARFSEQASNYTVLKGKNVDIMCDAIGDKPLSVGWNFNGNNLNWQGNKRLRVTYTNPPRGRGSSLSITNTQRSDSGLYMCLTKNKFGMDEMVIKLTILEKAEPPKNFHIEKTSSRSVEVAWLEPYNGNSPITSYIIQYKNASAVWQGKISNVTVDSSTYQTRIWNLHPAFTYHVRVMANNSIGISEPSKQITIMTSEEAPSGPPESIQVTATGSQSMKVSWRPPAASNRNGKIVGYYIGYKRFNSSEPYMYITQDLKVDDKLEYTILNLEKFTKYTVHVQAYNTKGAGPRSKEYTVLTLEDVPSQPPQGVQATPLSSQSIMVLWSPPPLFTLHGILQGYKVLYKTVRHDEDESDANMIISTKLTAALYGLQKFTNYSIEVLAFTRRGEGVRSNPIYVVTHQDLPERPADIKALASSENTILVTWKPPLHPNGVIQNYFLYMKYIEGNKMTEKRMKLPPHQTSFQGNDLERQKEYTYWVSASTAIGEGEATRPVTASPIDSVAARIASFSKVVISPWKQSVMLPCQAVGDPTPELAWSKRGAPLPDTERIKVFNNGSLYFETVETGDAANYSCKAHNIHGADAINVMLLVQAPPRKPILTVAVTTVSTIQVNWKSGSNGGSPIQGFVLEYKKEHDMWKNVEQGAGERSFTAEKLECGTTYKFRIRAFNKIGTGPHSEIVTVKTNGSVPIMPPQSMLLQEINTTFVVLALKTWLSGGCIVQYYNIEYQVWGDKQWTTVASRVDPHRASYVVEDLHPATWYLMKVTAYNDAGSTDSTLKFATLTYHGSTITPIMIMHKQSAQFYEKFYIMVPLVGSIVIATVVLVWVVLYCRRRKQALKYQDKYMDIKSNLRRDLTAETSLMNDLDKQLNSELTASGDLTYSPEPGLPRNVNLLVETGDDNDASSSYYQDTNTSNGQVQVSDDDINPYATFQFPAHLQPAPVANKRVLKTFSPRQSSLPVPPPEEVDEIAVEKKAAQREAAIPHIPPPPPEPVPKEPQKQNPTLQRNQNQYVSPGIILSPRKYASADQIQELYTGKSQPIPVLPKPKQYQQHYSRSATPRSNTPRVGDPRAGTPHQGMGHSQSRHSQVSSVSTVSSNRDELLQAYENAAKAPNSVSPLVDLENKDSSSQKTDSSETTEPGICQFTNSPPCPEEQRESVCEVPNYPHYYDLKPKKYEPVIERSTSDVTESDTYEQSQRVPPRRMKGRQKTKQRGQVLNKKAAKYCAPQVPGCESTSSNSTNGDEVTMVFDGHHDNHLATTADESHYSNSAKKRERPVNRKVGKYDSSPDTPGTDEQRPLVSAAAKTGKKDEDISLLDRYYRTIEKGRSAPALRTPSSSNELDVESERDYTDNYTIV